jgi:ribonuclease Z
MTNKIEIVFLGTGSAVPTLRKNHPAILLRYKDENILFDCGEGTQRQFRKAGLNPCKLTRLFISHWHGDHILGIPGLLQTLMLNNYNKTLEIYGPLGTQSFMSKILSMFVLRGDIHVNIHEISAGKVLETSDFEIYSEQMDHNTVCLAYRFVEKDKIRIDKNKLKKLKIGNSPLLKELKSGKDIVINGKKIKAKNITYLEKGKKLGFVFDTRINKNIDKIAKDADLFVCEATYFDEEELAKEYMHLTATQSADIAKKSKAKKLFLIHLSQKYDNKENKILQLVKKHFKNSAVAHDLIKVEV